MHALVGLSEANGIYLPQSHELGQATEHRFHSTLPFALHIPALWTFDPLDVAFVFFAIVGHRKLFQLDFIHGTTTGTTPLQKKFQLGSPSVLRGYPQHTVLSDERLFASRLDYKSGWGTLTINYINELKRENIIVFCNKKNSNFNYQQYEILRKPLDYIKNPFLIFIDYFKIKQILLKYKNYKIYSHFPVEPYCLFLPILSINNSISLTANSSGEINSSMPKV